MSEPTGARNPVQVPDGLDPLAVRDVSGWIQQWSRTLKTWRLYGEHNPTLEKFRVDLASGLTALLEARGPLTLKFTSDTIQWREAPVHQARTREDNLSGVFYRDGIQSITFSPGMERSELDKFLAATILASDRLKHADEDLVTLLWDAEFTHVDMNYVSSVASLDLEDEGDEGSGAGSGAGEGAGAAGGTAPPPMGWPSMGRGGGAESVESADPAQPGARGSSGAAGATVDSAATRSEDWPSRDPGGPLVEQFDELDALAVTAVTRFKRERAEEMAIDRGVATLSVVADAFGTGLQPGDSAELAPLLDRLCMDAMTRGEWAAARRAIALRLQAPARDGEGYAWLAPLARPDSLVTTGIVQTLDRQGQAEVAAFLELVTTIGARGLDWFLLMLAQSEQERVRRPLARAISEMGAGEIPRLTPWLNDSRWYVVRNIVHILSMIGGDATLAPAATVIRHEDQRVRLEVLTVLANATPEAARPLLFQMLESDDARVLSGALHQLSARRDREVAARMMERLRAPGFAERPADEQRAVLSAIGATGDDSLLPELGALLDPAKKPGPTATTLLQGLALCVARIATPAATQLLQQAQQKSRWRPTREAATLALTARGSR